MIQLDEAETNMCRNIPIGVPPLGLEPGVGPAAIVGAVVAGPPGDYTVKAVMTAVASPNRS